MKNSIADKKTCKHDGPAAPTNWQRSPSTHTGGGPCNAVRHTLQQNKNKNVSKKIHETKINPQKTKPMVRVRVGVRARVRVNGLFSD